MTSTADDTTAWFDVRVCHLATVAPRIGSGFPLGTHRTTGETFDIALVRSQPTTVVICGAYDTAAIIVVRALASGISVAVTTDRPGPWVGLRQAIGMPASALLVLGLNATMSDVPGSGPVLVVHEGPEGVNHAMTARRPWQTAMHVLPGVNAIQASVMKDADVVLVGSQSVESTSEALYALGLRDQTLLADGPLGESDIVALSGGVARIIVMSLTATERRLFGR